MADGKWQEWLEKIGKKEWEPVYAPKGTAGWQRGIEWAFIPWSLMGQATRKAIGGEISPAVGYETIMQSPQLRQSPQLSQLFGQEAIERAREYEEWRQGTTPWSTFAQYLPGGEQYAEYRQLPWWQQLAYEAPAWALTMGAPTAGALRAGLRPAAEAGEIIPKVTRAALAPVEAAEVVAAAPLRYGITLATKAVTGGAKKALELALDTGLDKWLVRQGIRGDQANSVIKFFLEKNNRWLYQRAESNWLRRWGEMKGVQQAAEAAATDTVTQAEPLLLRAAEQAGARPAVTKKQTLSLLTEQVARGETPSAELLERVGVRTTMPAEPSPAPIAGGLPYGTLENRLASETPDLTRYQARKQNTLVANELAEWIGTAPLKPTPITKETIRQSTADIIKNRVRGFFARSYRIEPLLDHLDGYFGSGRYELLGGKMTQTFWRPVEIARGQELSALYESASNLNNLLSESGTNLGRFFSEQVETAGLKLTHGERIGVYLNSQNAQNLVHMVMGNQLSVKAIDEIIASLTPAERAIADYMTTRAGSETPIIQKLVKELTGREMRVVQNYWPIQIEWRAGPEVSFNEALINEARFRATTRHAAGGIRKGFTLPRAKRALQPISLDAFDVFFRHLQGVEHYKAFAGVTRDMEQVLNSGSLKRAIVNKHGQAVWDVLNQWVKDVAATNPLAAQSWGQWLARQMRVNAVTAVLGFNIITSLKQFPSFVSGAAEVGAMPATKGLFTYLMHPKETTALIKKYSPELTARVLEREIAEARLARGAGQRLVRGKLTTREVFMFLTLGMDKIAVSSLWRGAFEDGLRKGMTAENAARWATRSVRRTQPYFDVKDLAEFWRSKDELIRALTMFTNQLNQYWNYYRFNIIGRRAAGKISNLEVIRRIFLAFLIPAAMIGAISRSRPPKDAGEFVRDTASMGFATVPLVGHWLSSAILGWQNQGLISTELMERLHEIAYQANRGEWDKVFTTIPEAGGYLFGVPVAQPRRTIMAMIELANGNSEDLLSLIWGSYTRKKATEGEEERQGLPELPKLPELPELPRLPSLK